MAEQVTIRFFASLREQLGLSTLAMPLSDRCTSRELWQLVSEQPTWQRFELAEREVLVAVNQQLCDWQTMVQPGDEVAFFPPVTGG